MVRISSALIAAICLTTGGAVVPLRALADDAPPEPNPPATVSLPSEEIARLIQQLDAPEFEVREEATKKLSKGGKRVIAPVATAAESVSLEAGTRCVAVLKELYQSRDPEVKGAAHAALKQLADGSNRPVARRAAEILTPPARTSARKTAGVNIAGINVAGLPAGQAVRISSRTTNGRTEIEVTTGETKISIAHSSGKDIIVKVQEPAPAPGKEPAVKEYKARDLDELKEKHPEAHAHYEKYAGRVRTINLANIAAAVRPGLPANRGPELPAETRQALADLQAARSEMSRLYSKVSELSRRTDVKQDELKSVLDELKALSDRIAEIQKKLPK